MKEKILVIDGHNLAHRASHKFNLTNKQGTPSGVLFGFVYILRPLIVQHSPDKVIITFDGGRSQYRKDLLMGYKLRESALGSDKESFERQLTVLKKLLPALGCWVNWAIGVEADDIIYKICRNNPKKYITIVSSDKDFIPLINSYIKVWNPFKGKLITTQNVEEIYGYEADRFLDYLILLGDKSDKIPGVPGIGKVRGAEFLEEFGTIVDYLESDSPGKWVKYDIEEVYKRNKALISLVHYFVKQGRKETYDVIEPNYNRKVLLKVCREYNINKFLGQEFTKPFENL